MDAVVQNQQMKQSNTFFTFFPYHYLKLGVVQMKSVFDLSFQESTYSMRHVSSSLKLTHLLLLVTAFYLPCCPWFVSRPGGWENCFFISCYHNSPLPSLAVRLMLVSVFSYLLGSESFIISNREPSVFPPTKPFPLPLVLLHLFQFLYKLSFQHCGRTGTLCVTRLFYSLRLPSYCGGHVFHSQFHWKDTLHAVPPDTLHTVPHSLHPIPLACSSPCC